MWYVIQVIQATGQLRNTWRRNMPRNTIIYDLLIIGPSDTEKYFICIKRAIERFNTGVGKEKRITVIGRDLNNQIFAESGGESGVLVRNQIIGKFDMVAAVFWEDI